MKISAVVGTLLAALLVAAAPAAASGAHGSSPLITGVHVTRGTHAHRLKPESRAAGWRQLMRFVKRYERSHHGRATSRARTSAATPPKIKVTDKGFACSVPDPSFFDGGVGASAFETSDSVEFQLPWRDSANKAQTSLTGTCSGNVSSIASNGNPGTVGFDCLSGNTALGMYVVFADGELVDTCDQPTSTLKSSEALGGINTGLGFKCEATVGEGKDDATPINITNDDSLQYTVIYGPSSAAFTPGDLSFAATTACVGSVAKGAKISTKIVTHQVACSQVFGDGTGPAIPSYGISVTYPDGQYSETCTAPDFSLTTISST
jgi:hypothetical protein